MTYENDGKATIIAADDGTKIARIEVFGETTTYALNRASGPPPIAPPTIHGFSDEAMEMVKICTQKTVEAEAADSNLIVEVNVVRNHGDSGEGCFVVFLGKVDEAKGEAE